VPDTLEALLVLIIGILPGALHVWASERESGRWGIGLSDRVLRFVGATAIYQAIFGYPVYLAWQHFIHHRVLDASGRVVFVNRITQGGAPGWAWILPALYVAIPLAIGTVSGMSSQRWPRLSRILLGRDPAPRAWDYLLSSRPVGVIRARLKSEGRWIGGWFGPESYAAGYPEELQDLFLQRTYVVLADGTFAEGNSPQGYQETGSALLVRWEDIEELEFFPS